MNTGLKRNTIDKFYTKPEIVDMCIDIVQTSLIIDKDDLIIEPSAGDGKFLDEIRIYHENVEGYDIKPENINIKEQDFLKLSNKTENDVHFIGNPPFGRQSSLARKFVKHCCSFDKCKSISFILPKSFRTETYQKSFDSKFHLIHEEELPNNSFTINNDNYSVPCVFQVWKKKDYDRIQKEKISEIDFHFVKKPNVEITKFNDENKPIEKKNIFQEEIPDFAILRAGGGNKCGRISKDIYNGIGCYPEAWLFIKLNDNIDKNKFEEQYKKIDWSSDTNVGAKSISKPIFIKGINSIINQLK